MFFISLHLWCVWFHPLNICYLTFVQTNFNCFFFHSSTSCIYSWLPITRTLANSNQSRFPLDFLLTFTVILPSVTWTSRWLEVIFFPSAHFYTILPSIIRTMLIGAWKVGKKTVHWSPKPIEFISKQPSQFFVFTFCHSSSNSVFIPYFVA